MDFVISFVKYKSICKSRFETKETELITKSNDCPPLQCHEETKYVDLRHLAFHCETSIEQYLKSDAYKNCVEKLGKHKEDDSVPRWFMHPIFAYDIIKFSNCQNGDVLWIKILSLILGDDHEKVFVFFTCLRLYKSTNLLLYIVYQT